jgi:hypothetical protein
MVNSITDEEPVNGMVDAATRFSRWSEVYEGETNFVDGK